MMDLLGNLRLATPFVFGVGIPSAPNPILLTYTVPKPLSLPYAVPAAVSLNYAVPKPITLTYDMDGGD